MTLLDVSIVIPARNAADHLPDTLRSVEPAALKGAEVLLVDDGSTDDTAAVFAEAASSWPAAHVHSQAWLGLGAARNAGIGLAHAKYVAFLDSDDWLYSSGLETLLVIAEQSSSPVTRGTETRHRYGESPEEFTGTGRVESVRSSREMLRAFGGTLRSVYQRQFLLENRIRYPESLTFAEDLPFAVEVAASARTFLDVDMPLYSYRTGSPGQLSSPGRLDTWPRLVEAFSECERRALPARIELRSALCASEIFYAWRGLPQAGEDARQAAVSALREFARGSRSRLGVPAWRVAQDLAVMTAMRVPPLLSRFRDGRDV